MIYKAIAGLKWFVVAVVFAAVPSFAMGLWSSDKETRPWILIAGSILHAAALALVYNMGIREEYVGVAVMVVITSLVGLVSGAALRSCLEAKDISVALVSITAATGSLIIALMMTIITATRLDSIVGEEARNRAILEELSKAFETVAATMPPEDREKLRQQVWIPAALAVVRINEKKK